MKKTSSFFLIPVILLSFASLFAQDMVFWSVHAGYMNPKNVEAGMLFGGSIYKEIDNAVSVGIGADIFQKVYTETSEVANTQTQNDKFRTYATEVEYKRIALPIFLGMKIKLPLTYNQDFGYFARANLSYQFLWSKEKNYIANKSENRKFGGLGWQAGLGLYYRIGSRSHFTAEAIYNSCTVSRNVSNPTSDLPLSEQVDLSGGGIRLGVEIEMK